MWNCCRGGVEPDWSRFVGLELQGCVMVEGESVEALPATDSRIPEFYALYGRLACGEVEAINDFNLPEVDRVRVLCEAISISAALPLQDLTTGKESR